MYLYTAVTLNSDGRHETVFETKLTRLTDALNSIRNRHRTKKSEWLTVRSGSKSGQGRLHTHVVVCGLFYDTVSNSGSKTSSSAGVSFLDIGALRKSSMDKLNALWVKWDMKMTQRKVPPLILRQWAFFTRTNEWPYVQATVHEMKT